MENGNLNTTKNFFEPMTAEESFRFIEMLESNQFVYDEWEITRDIHYITKYDQLIHSCDPRLQSMIY
ncbi:MAG: hypothetical protein JJU37_00095 [Balneolaceae bacterium]|nr:hypothetical protein [Balneolaceae bacterium]